MIYQPHVSNNGGRQEPADGSPAQGQTFGPVKLLVRQAFVSHVLRPGRFMPGVGRSAPTRPHPWAGSGLNSGFLRTAAHSLQAAGMILVPEARRPEKLPGRRE